MRLLSPVHTETCSYRSPVEFAVGGGLGGESAFRCAAHLCMALGRDAHTVHKWVHDFNARGLSALVYRHTGGSAPRRHALAPLLGEVLEQARIDAAVPVSKKLAAR